MAFTAPAGRYIGDILGGLHAPDTPANRRALVAWARAEGGSARFNPFNTTQGAPGAGSYNSVGVRNYTSYQQGLRATLETLRNGHYGAIIQALHAGRNPLAVASAVGSSPWGTSGSLMASILGGHVSVPSGGGSGSQGGGGGRQGGGLPHVMAQQQALAQTLMNFAQTGSTLTPGTSPLQQMIASQMVSRTPAQRAGGAGQSYSGPASGKAGQALSFAKSAIGTPYVWGGESRKGFDCSGLVQWAFGKAGITVPRTSQEQIQHGRPVKWGSFHPGDLIFSNFEGPGAGASHVVIYLGHGKVIAAPHTGSHVQVEDVNLFKQNFVGARRYF